MSRNYNDIDPLEYDRMYATVPREIYMKKHWGDLIENAIGRYCKDKYVLDLGCGYGNYTKIISKYTDNIIGLDISQRWVDCARKQCPHTKFLLADAHNIPLENDTFDVIVSIGLFEYVQRSIAIKEIYRVLKNDGISIISVPNKYSISRAPYKLFHKILREKYPPNEPSKKEMLGLLQHNNFGVIEYKINDGLIYLPNFLDKIIGRITYSFVEKLFSLFGENPFSNVMLFVSKKIGK
jgi:ubiquinone/menaquinone biosynthesis C-methylase UbiE